MTNFFHMIFELLALILLFTGAIGLLMHFLYALNF